MLDQVTGWTDFRVEQLKSLYEQGLSCSQIAAELHHVTRNSVIGKVHRLGLERRGRGNGGGAKPRLRIVRSNANRNARRVIVIHTPAQLRELRCAEIVSRELTLLDLQPNDCRYPTSDGSPFLFCGHAKLKGQPYCAGHYALTLKEKVA